MSDFFTEFMDLWVRRAGHYAKLDGLERFRGRDGTITSISTEELMASIDNGDEYDEDEDDLGDGFGYEYLADYIEEYDNHDGCLDGQPVPYVKWVGRVLNSHGSCYAYELPQELFLHKIREYVEKLERDGLTRNDVRFEQDEAYVRRRLEAHRELMNSLESDTAKTGRVETRF